MKEKNGNKSWIKEYRSPIPEGVPTRIVYPIGKHAHAGWAEFAKDFMIPVGTPIEAVENGEVISVKSDSNKHGLDEKFTNEVNYVTVKSGDSFIEYLHLGKDKVRVKVGDQVSEGQILGLSGLSGRMKGGHLHMHKFMYDEDGNPKAVPYNVKGVYDEKRVDEKSLNYVFGVLEKLVGGIFLLGVGGALLFFSGITGAVIGSGGSSFYGIISLGAGLLAGGVWMFLRKRIVG